MNLFNSSFLSIALAIIICWSLFALFCSILQEAIAQVMADRGRFMKKYLLQQLQDKPNGINWGLQLYQHGSIDLLTRAPNKPTNQIDPTLFAKCLVEVVGNTHQVRSKMGYASNGYKHSLLYYFKGATQVLQESDVMQWFGQALKSAEISGSDNGVTDEKLVYEHLVSSIEEWYNSFLDRLDLWYKKKTRMRLFILGILLGIFLNVDSVQLFSLFNHNPAATAALVHYYDKNGEELSKVAHRLDSSGLSRTDSSFQQSTRELRHYTQSMDSLRRVATLPIGFEESFFVSHPSGFGAWLLKLLGILISGLAASFGAPFWFDLLKKLYSKNV